MKDPASPACSSLFGSPAVMCRRSELLHGVDIARGPCTEMLPSPSMTNSVMQLSTLPHQQECVCLQASCITSGVCHPTTQLPCPACISSCTSAGCCWSAWLTDEQLGPTWQSLHHALSLALGLQHVVRGGSQRLSARLCFSHCSQSVQRYFEHTGGAVYPQPGGCS